jgi:secreted trypsin-like serine protease
MADMVFSVARRIDKTGAARLKARMSRALFLAALSLLFVSPAAAMVGGAASADGVAQAAVMLVGSRGNFCTGTLIARDLVLTAAHCVLPGADYKLLEFDAQHQPQLRDTRTIARHPQFSLETLLGHRATADVALVKLAAPLSKPVAVLATASPTPAPGDSFLVAGYGLAERGNGKTGGTLRAASLVATGKPGNLQIRLVDPRSRGARAGLGACTGDSGGPVFAQAGGRLAVIGVVSWSTGPNNSEGCGGLTGVTPLSLYRAWIVETARKLGSPLAP